MGNNKGCPPNAGEGVRLVGGSIVSTTTPPNSTVGTKTGGENSVSNSPPNMNVGG